MGRKQKPRQQGQARPFLRGCRAVDWNTALILTDDREDYGEDRMIAQGFIDARLYILVFTRRGENIRIISLRKASKKEIQTHEKTA